MHCHCYMFVESDTGTCYLGKKKKLCGSGYINFKNWMIGQKIFLFYHKILHGGNRTKKRSNLGGKLWIPLENL